MTAYAIFVRSSRRGSLDHERNAFRDIGRWAIPKTYVDLNGNQTASWYRYDDDGDGADQSDPEVISQTTYDAADRSIGTSQVIVDAATPDGRTP